MRVILNADDFGMTHEANLGIEKGMLEGCCSQTSVVVNTNYFDEAVEIAERHGFKDKVGLHINLFDGTPLSSNIKSLKRYTYYDMFRYRPGIVGSYLPIDVEAIGEELEAQIRRYLSGGFTLMNIDSHHCAFYDKPVLEALIPLLKKYGFKSVRYIGNSYFNGKFSHEFYGRRWIRRMDQTGLAHVNYSSSVRTYERNKSQGSPVLAEQDAIEVYVHPVLVEGSLIDDYTGGAHLRESLEHAGLTPDRFMTSRELWS